MGLVAALKMPPPDLPTISSPSSLSSFSSLVVLVLLLLEVGTCGKDEFNIFNKM